MRGDMNIFQKAWFRLLQGLLYVHFRFGIWRAWAKFCQWLYESEYKGLRISSYRTFAALEEALDRLVYTGDGPWRLWDSTSSAERVEFLIRHSLRQANVDCDEWSVYIAKALNESVRRGMFKEPYFAKARMLTVFWRAADGSYNGHNVALLRFQSESGEWYSYMDYGVPSEPKNEVSEVVQDVIEAYAPGATMLMCSISDDDLRHIETHLG